MVLAFLERCQLAPRLLDALPAAAAEVDAWAEACAEERCQLAARADRLRAAQGGVRQALLSADERPAAASAPARNFSGSGGGGGGGGDEGGGGGSPGAAAAAAAAALARDWLAGPVARSAGAAVERTGLLLWGVVGRLIDRLGR